MKQILLPTDFSENSLNAIFYAIDMYRGHPCRFILLNTFKVNGYDSESKLSAIPDPNRFEKIKKEAEDRLKKIIIKISAGKNKAQHEFVVVASNAPLTEAIKEQIEEKNIEVVIIGTQGSTGAYEIVYGSNTIHIMEEIENCPILAVPSHVSFQPIKEIVLPNGYKIKHHKKDFDYIKNLSQRFGASVRVLHVAENGGLSNPQELNKKHLALYLRDISHSFHMLEHVSLPIGIYCFTESRGSDLIAFVNKKHNFFHNLLFSPLYKNIGHYSKVPVLILQKTKVTDS